MKNLGSPLLEPVFTVCIQVEGSVIVMTGQVEVAALILSIFSRKGRQLWGSCGQAVGSNGAEDDTPQDTGCIIVILHTESFHHECHQASREMNYLEG